MIILKILQSLLQALNNNNEHLLIQKNGNLVSATSFLNQPLMEEEVLRFEEKNGYQLPKDYRTFLLNFDGAKIYQQLLHGKNIGGGLKLFSLEEVVEHHFDIVNIHPGYLPIGDVEQQHLAISIDGIESKNPNYLFLLSNIEGPIPLHLNLSIFVDRFIVSQGAAFWEWPFESAENPQYSDE